MHKKELIKEMKQYSILYVEDETNIRKHIVEFLQRYFKIIYEAGSSEDALEMYKHNKPDILILDINLPGINGIELASLIRKDNLKTRIVMSTAYTNKEFMTQAVELDLTRYLVKPVIGSELLLALEKAIIEIRKITGVDLIYNLGEGFIYFKEKKIIKHNTQIITLRKKEIEVLEFFLANSNNTVTYEMIETQIWFDNVMTMDAVRSQIKNIRQKTYNHMFKNVSGIGYKFVDFKIENE